MLRELLRFGRQLVEAHSAERNRLLKLLESTGLKLPFSPLPHETHSEIFMAEANQRFARASASEDNRHTSTAS
ncbi:MAG: hypothetical protein WA005_07280 [Candidatus Binataceae bacterium]